MIKNKVLRFGFLAIVLVMLAIGAFAFSIQTHAAASSVSASTTSHVSILRTTKALGGYVYGKSTATATHGTPFTFINRTKIAQSVTFGKTTLLTIPPKSSATYTWAKAGSYTLSLTSNTGASVTVTVS